MRQRRRKRAVVAVAIGGRGAGLGRIGDQDVRAGRLDLGETLPDRARGHRALHGPGKRIVAAGVEDHEPQFLGRLDRDQHAVERQGFVIDVGVAFELGIHRNQVIAAVHLDAMAGVIDDGDIGIAGAVGKIAQRAPGVGGGEILAGIDDIEAGIFQRRGDPGAVVNRIGERGDILVGGIAQHQRHALLGKGRPADQQRCGRRKHPSKQSRDPDFIMTLPEPRIFYHTGLPSISRSPGFVSYVTNHAHVNRALASSLVGRAPGGSAHGRSVFRPGSLSGYRPAAASMYSRSGRSART